MYRYYSTQRPVAPGTYPGRPATLGNYGSNGTDIDYLGHVWGWLDYEDELTAEQADAYELKPAGKTPMYYAISETTARQAKRMNSFSDYVEGSATAGYRVEVDRAAYLAYRQKRRIDPMYHDRVDSLLSTYARKLAENLNAYYSIQTRCPSILIAGGSNFPVAKKEKQNRAADRNMQEWKDIQGILDKIRSTGKGGISSDDPDDEGRQRLLAQAQDPQGLPLPHGGGNRKGRGNYGLRLAPRRQAIRLVLPLQQQREHPAHQGTHRGARKAQQQRSPGRMGFRRRQGRYEYR